MKKIAVLLLILVVFESCATILVGTKQKISIDSEPQGASVNIGGKNIGNTPLEVEVKRKLSPCELKLEKEGYQITNGEIEQQGEPIFLYNVLNLFLLSWIDIITGSVVRYPEYNYFKLNPIPKEDTGINDEIFDKLNKIKSLYDNGIITEDEFNEQKKKLLEKIK